MILEEFLQILNILNQNIDTDSPAYKLKYSYKRNPYTILMTTLLSLRTKDENTAKVASKLFNTIQTPQQLLQLSQEELETIVRPTGMYRQKAQTLIDISQTLINKFNSKVPQTKDELLSLKGVGEKTANIVLNNAFSGGTIAVDTHVHRLCNMWNIIDTKDEKQSSKVLNEIIPTQYKENLNFSLVSFGQTVCTIKNTKCDICRIKNIYNLCEKITLI